MAHARYSTKEKLAILWEAAETRFSFKVYEDKYDLPVNTISTFKRQLKDGKLGAQPKLTEALKEAELFKA